MSKHTERKAPNRPYLDQVLHPQKIKFKDLILRKIKKKTKENFK